MAILQAGNLPAVEKRFCIQQRVLNGFPGWGGKLGATRAMADLWVPGVNKQGAQYPLTFGESEVFKQIQHEDLRKWGFRHAKQLWKRDLLILASWMSSWGNGERPREGFTLKARWSSDLCPEQTALASQCGRQREYLESQWSWLQDTYALGKAT